MVAKVFTYFSWRFVVLFTENCFTANQELCFTCLEKGFVFSSSTKTKNCELGIEHEFWKTFGCNIFPRNYVELQWKWGNKPNGKRWETNRQSTDRCVYYFGPEAQKRDHWTQICTEQWPCGHVQVFRFQRHLLWWFEFDLPIQLAWRKLRWQAESKSPKHPARRTSLLSLVSLSDCPCGLV